MATKEKQVSFLLARCVQNARQGKPPAHREAAHVIVPQYEITYILSPGLEEPKVVEVSTHFSDVAKNNGAESIAVEQMGKRRLAYEIKRQREGYYVSMRFSGAADAAKEVVRQLRLHDDVLRALLVKP